MSSETLISIIMNCRNSDRYLRQAIDSVYEQTHENWEIIFWDNQSDDLSEKIAKSYDDRVKYFLAYEFTDLGTARSLAIEKVRGDYVSFLDCDDIYLPEKLERQLSFMEREKYPLSYHSLYVINEFNSVLRKQRVKNKSGYIFGPLLVKYEINMQSVMVRHDLLEKGKYNFSRDLRYCPDHNLFMRIAAHNPIGVIHEYLAKYRKAKNSLSTDTVDIAAYEIRYTLDLISRKHPYLVRQYSQEFNIAYNKLRFYDAIASLHKGDRKNAKKSMRAIVTTRVVYLAIYIILMIPISDRIVLRILGR